MNIYSYIHVSVALTLSGCFDPAGTNPRPQNLVDDWRDEVIYQIVTDRFADGDRNNDFGVDEAGLSLARYQGGDFQGIKDHLDYLEALGVTTLWISPVTRAVEEDAGIAGYHGYWPQDFDHVNPHFGDLAALRELVAACHARHLKVVLDIVVNHVGQLFYYDINENGQPDDTLIGTGNGGPLGAPPGAPVGHVSEFDPDFDPRGVQAATTLGPAGLAPIRFFYWPDVDRMPPEPGVFQNPDFYHRKGRITDYTDRQQVLLGDFPGGLKDLATERTDVQLALISAYTRWMDAADFDGFRIDTVKHVDHDFWQVFAPAIRAHAQLRGKNFLQFGEVFDGDDTLVGSYTQNGELDSVQDFPHKFRVIDAVFKNGAPTREIQTLADERPMHYDAAAIPLLVRFLDNHDVPRFLFDKPDPAALRSALAYLLTSDGIPSIYYGTEQEFSGGNDPANRERLWPTGFREDGETFRWIAALVKLRKQLAPLRRGDMTFRWVSDRSGSGEDLGIVAYERAFEGERVLVVVNASDQMSHTAFSGSPMVTGFPPSTTLRVVFPPEAQGIVTTDAGSHLTIDVPPRSIRVLTP